MEIVNKRITLIGAGNISTAAIKGWQRSNKIKLQNITVSDIDISKLKKIENMGVNTASDNTAAVIDADIVILAVKPFKTIEIVENLKHLLDEKTIISLAAGITLAQIEKQLKTTTPLFRIIPNTAMAIQESITFVANDKKFEDKKKLVLDLFNLLGKTLSVEENQMDALTVLGSCGIAYALRFIRAMMIGGIQIGVNDQLSIETVNQIVKGAVRLLEKEKNHPEMEIDQVTTPNGITITGLNKMEEEGFSSAVVQGVLAAFNKAKK